MCATRSFALPLAALLSFLIFCPSETVAQAANKSKAAAKPSSKPGEGVWVNYDFVPGARVILYEDFSTDKVGNFPRRFKLVSGNMEVAEWQGRRWLRTPARSEFLVPLPEQLPERFTLEFEYFPAGNSSGTEIHYDKGAVPYTVFHGHISGVRGPGLTATTRTDDPILGKTEPFHCRVMADGDYVKVYANETRVANVPNAPLGRSKSLRVVFPGTSGIPIMLTNLRIAESSSSIYEELEADGRVTLAGILFDTGSDVIRPESTPTLKEVGAMLTDHPDMKVLIEGHTDNVGDDALNQALSDRRATAVRSYLVAHFAIDGGRLKAGGMGETKPTAANDTPEGRESNRRVELVAAR